MVLELAEAIMHPAMEHIDHKLQVWCFDLVTQEWTVVDSHLEREGNVKRE